MGLLPLGIFSLVERPFIGAYSKRLASRSAMRFAQTLAEYFGFVAMSKLASQNIEF